MTPQEFVAKWRGSTSTERQAYQQHFLDLCRLVGHPTPAELDPENKFFTFEAGAAKQSGGQGWADVWYRGHFAIEYKGPHGDLGKAYSQLLQYRESLENPPLLIVSNIQSLTIHTNFTGTAKKIVTITLDDLLTPQGLQQVRNIFYNPEAFRPAKTAAQVTEEAATRFAHLAEHLRKWGYSPHEIAHYSIRLLFCLFAEDIDLLPRELFTRLVDKGRRDPKAFARQVRQLFHAMTEGADFGEHPIRYFDGGLVRQRDEWLNPPALDEKQLAKRTLTNLYNERPDWLDEAHKKLNAAVFDAYGWPHDLSDEEILARVLVLNLERAKG